MINGLDIYYSKNVGRGLKSVSVNKQTILNKGKGLKPISKERRYKGSGLKILQ